MHTEEAVAQYARQDELSPPEKTLLNLLAPSARNRPILDIGVGGGRTVKALTAISEDYVGVDYSREMIEVCAKRFSNRRFEYADARALSRFVDGSFFLVCFSCNGIGMVNHHDRLRILNEVLRVLVPGGAFLFSTHNRNSPEFDGAFRFPSFERTMNPAKALVRGARFLGNTIERVKNRRKHKPLEVIETEYAVLNDECHNYGTLLYYISLEAQRRQLVEVGFEHDAIACDLSGAIIEDDSRDHSILLSARKPLLTRDAMRRISTVPPPPPNTNR